MRRHVAVISLLALVLLPAGRALAGGHEAAPAAPAPAAQAAAPQPGQQPNLTAVKADFVPGDKTVFFDDFSDMVGDEPPPHWKVRGGSFALKTAPGIRQLTTTSDGTLTARLRGLPKNFTVQGTVVFEHPGDFRSVWSLVTGDDNEALRLFLQTQGDNLLIRMMKGDEDLGSKSIPATWGEPIDIAWWLQNGRLRAYANGQRLIDVNEIALPAIAWLAIQNQLYGNEGNGAIGYRMVRVAESAPDFSQIINSTGRYVTHGILFDTDSDRLKPESAPVVKLVAQGLAANPALKLLIEGHTDSTGDAAHNLDLSKRRAEAVKAVLATQFGVDASRLTTAGLGSTKPVAPNDTPQGRAQNRRVEFVKQ